MRTVVLAGVSVCALLMLSACGGGGEEAEPAATAEAPAAPATTPSPNSASTGAQATGATAGDVAAPPSPATASAAAGGGEVLLAGLTGDATRGQKVFAQCRTCHVLDAGVNKVGPSLNGIVGRKAGTVPNFRYSPANQNGGIVWTEEVLFAYLENPRKYMPGTYMSFVGLKQPQQRADVIAYLKTAS